MANQNDDKKLIVVIVPYPAQSHLNMALHLSHLISSYNIPVHYGSSTQHNAQIKLRNPDIVSHGLVFHDFHLPSCGDQVEIPTTLPHLQHPVAALIRDLSSKYVRVVVVHDALMASVVKPVSSLHNARAYAFITSSAFSNFVNYWLAIREKPFALDDPSILPSDLPSAENSCIPPDFMAFIKEQYKLNYAMDSGTIYNTSRVIEGPYIGLLEKTLQKGKHFAVGPVNDTVSAKPREQCARHRCLEWLDLQEKDSVLYISFGTTITFPEEQIQELATGLEKSSHKFIWVIRNADKGDIFATDEHDQGNRLVDLLESFMERVRGKGMVLTNEWVPQVDILRHHSVGGFMTHCGWGSLTESLSSGVPLISYPVHCDQPLNSILVTQVLRVGLLVRDDYWETRGQVIRSDIIESVVRRLMGSDEGEGMRRRAKELGQSIRGSMAQGGASHNDMDSFIADISRP